MPLKTTTYGSVQYVENRTNSISALFSGLHLLPLIDWDPDTNTYIQTLTEGGRETDRDVGGLCMSFSSQTVQQSVSSVFPSTTHTHAPWDVWSMQLLPGSFRYDSCRILCRYSRTLQNKMKNYIQKQHSANKDLMRNINVSPLRHLCFFLWLTFFRFSI